MDTNKESSQEYNNQQHTVEQPRHSPEHTHETPQSHLETSSERLDQSERAKDEALELATKADKKQQETEATTVSKAGRRGAISKKQLDNEFATTMKHAREDMSPVEKTFSKFIHTPTIEKTSDFLAATIARPNALLAGSAGAFILTLAVYLFAKSVGYPLSGFEPIAAFIIGWAVGILYDYFRIMVTGKH